VRDEHHCCLSPCVSGGCLWLRSAAGVHVFVLQPCPCPPRAEPAAGASPSVLIIAPFPLRAQALLRWSGMAGWRPLSHSPAGRTPRRGDSAVRRRCGKAATISSSSGCRVRRRAASQPMAARATAPAVNGMESSNRIGTSRERRRGPLTVLAATMALLRSEEHTSELQSRENLVCRL